MSEKERILEILRNNREPMHTANIWFEMSFNVPNPQGDKSSVAQTLLELEQEGQIRHSIVSCLDYWTYIKPNILQRLMNRLRGKQDG